MHLCMRVFGYNIHNATNTYNEASIALCPFRSERGEKKMFILSRRKNPDVICSFCYSAEQSGP